MHDGRRICLLVLGMHRSGTSAVARVASLLGADLPKVVMGPNRGNERGHWEPERLVACHDRLLEKLGSRWNDWRSLDAAERSTRALADFKPELSDLIDADYPHSGLFVLKEPRLCRLVPFYAELLREKGIEPRYLLVIRNPLAVIHSLSDRDGILPGRVALLWLRHALDAEHATRAASRAVVSYEQVLLDWRPAMQRVGARLSLRWPRSLDAAAADITAFLTSEMQHFAPSRRELAARDDVPVWVRQAYRALLDLEINPDDDTATAMLDGIRDAFDAASPMFADALQREIDTRRGELAAVRADAVAKAARIKQQDADLAGLRAELAKRDASIGALKGEIAARETQLAVGEGTIKGLTAQVEAQREEIARFTEDSEAARAPETPHALRAVMEGNG
ncbi:MAG: hypothetical protein ACKVP3_12010 [Hyphomicrobiaceae bacterium]